MLDKDEEGLPLYVRELAKEKEKNTTTKGQMYGGNKMAHNPTVIVECHPSKNYEDRYAILEKNRGNELDVCYDIYKKQCFKWTEKGERKYF